MNLDDIKNASPAELGRIIESTANIEPHVGPLIRAMAAARRLDMLRSLGNEEAAKVADQVEANVFDVSYETILGEVMEMAHDDSDGDFWAGEYEDDDIVDDYQCDDPFCDCRQGDPGDETDADAEVPQYRLRKPFADQDAKDQTAGYKLVENVDPRVSNPAIEFLTELVNELTKDGAELPDLVIEITIGDVTGPYGLPFRGASVKFREPKP